MSSTDEARGSHAWGAEAVAGLRYDLGLSQDEFSRILGVRQQTVSEWETGLQATFWGFCSQNRELYPYNCNRSACSRRGVDGDSANTK